MIEFKDMKKLINAELSGRGGKSAARKASSDDFRMGLMLRTIEALQKRRVVVSTSASEAADAELDTLVGTPEYAVRFAYWLDKLGKKEITEVAETVYKDTAGNVIEDYDPNPEPDDNGEIVLDEREVTAHTTVTKKTRLPYSDLAAAGLSTELHGARFGQVRKLDSDFGFVVERVMALLGRYGMPAAMVLEYLPDLPKRAPWEKVRSTLMSAAASQDPPIPAASVAKCFGLETEEDAVVVPSDDFDAETAEAKEAKKEAKEAKKAARQAAKAKAS